MINGIMAQNSIEEGNCNKSKIYAWQFKIKEPKLRTTVTV